MKAYHVKFWASTIRPEDRTTANLTDGSLFRHGEDAQKAVRDLRSRGCSIYCCELQEITGEWLESYEEWKRLGSMTADELHQIRMRREGDEYSKT